MKTKILILGGSHFIGRRLVETLIELDQFHIGLFNRGKTNKDLFPNLEIIIGNRNDNNQEGIKNGKWEIIIDLSCYFPDHLQKTLKNLPASLKHYIFLSTCSVYDNKDVTNLLRDENATVLACDEEEYFNEEANSYGARKAECERILAQSAIANSIFRPALVYGKYDSTDRLYYWPYQVKFEKKLLLPEGGKRLFSVTFVEDLVAILISSIKGKIPKDTYNAISHPKTSISRIIEASCIRLNKNPKKVELPASFLKENSIQEWLDIPLWLNTDIFTFSNEKILREIDFRFQDFQQSLDNSIDYFESLNWPSPKSGLSKTKKRKLELDYEEE